MIKFVLTLLAIALINLARCRTLWSADLPQISNIVFAEEQTVELPSNYTELQIRAGDETIYADNLSQLNVTELRICGKTLKKIENGALCSSPTLKILEIDFYENRNPPVLTKETFANCDDIEELLLKFDNEEMSYKLDQDVLENIPNLKKLYVESYNISSLSKDFLKLPANALTTLYFSRCNLHEIEPDAFENLNNLEEIVILHNSNLTTIPKQLFKNTPKLKRLILRQNGIEKLIWDEFEELTNLEELNLVANKITAFDGTKIAINLPKLKMLTIDLNPLLGKEKEDFVEQPKYKFKTRPGSKLFKARHGVTKAITNLLNKKLDDYQPLDQEGFRENYNAMNQLLALKILIEKSREYNFPIFLGFVDFHKEFDTLETWAIKRGLCNCRIDYRYSKLLEHIAKGTVATYQIHDNTQPIELQTGESLSPTLFTLALEDVFKQLNWEAKGISVNGRYLNNLRYGDDVVVIATSQQELQALLQELHGESEKVGLLMNLRKTKVMFVEEGNITVNNNIIEKTEEIIFLGQKFMLGKGNQEIDISRRIKQGWSAFEKLSFILKNKKINIKNKRKLFDSSIIPVLNYGAENLIVKQKNLNKLRVTQQAMERAMLGISLRDRKTNEWVRNVTKVTDIVEKGLQTKWRYAGYVARSEPDHWLRTLLQWIPSGYKRPIGRPPMRWSDDLKISAGPNWMQVAENIDTWKSIEEAYIQKWSQLKRY